MIHVGIDNGGTFTDLVGIDTDGTRFEAKVPSTPANPLAAVFSALDDAGIEPSRSELLVLGTTLGTNALLERNGAHVAYVASDGFEDVPHIQRGNRKFHYDLHWRKPTPFVARHDCLGVRERVDSRGRIVVPLDEDELERTCAEVAALDVDAVAVNLLFSYVNPTHELALGEALRRRLPGVTVSLSHEVAPVWREYERGISTIADAYLKPLLAGFVETLESERRRRGFTGPAALLRSNGGTALVRTAAKAPLQLLLSGLAGGVIGAERLAGAERGSLITLDMGGTSCDVAVVPTGGHRLASGYELEFGLPLVFPAIEISTIGAGGGSIAWIDVGGFLRVGPQSAGADPGPACYGRGGREPTMTDANVVLGRLGEESLAGGRLRLEPALAREALARLGRSLDLDAEDAALAVVAIANENMVSSIRVRTVEIGIDPRPFALVAIGGAGPLHAAAVARRLGIGRVIVPPHPGLASAYGALAAGLQSDHVRTVYRRSDSVDAGELGTVLRTLREAAIGELREQGYEGAPTVSVFVAMRYAGQNYEHEVELDDAELTEAQLHAALREFERLHEEFYGYELGGQVIEIVAARASARGDATLPQPTPHAASGGRPRRRRVRFRSGARDVPVYRRAMLVPGATVSGPAVIEEMTATTLLEAGDRLTVGPDDVLVLDIARGEG